LAYREMIRQYPTPQSMPLPGREAEMAPNLARGYGFKADLGFLFRKWLMLGTPNNLYYESGQENVKEHLKLAQDYMVQAEAKAVGEMILDASFKAVNRHTPILALAVFSTVNRDDYNRSFQPLALHVLRTGSHLLELIGYIRELRGFGPKVRKMLSRWFTMRDAKTLAYQVLKYQNRYGWRMRDVLRMVKIQGRAWSEIDSVFGWIAGKVGEKKLPDLLAVYEKMCAASFSEEELCATVRAFGLTWEMIPGNQKLTPAVWRALFDGMPVEATIRNLGNLTEKGLFRVGTFEDVEALEERLSVEKMARTHIHPLNLAMQARMYNAGGEGGKSQLRWAPHPKVSAILYQRAEDLMTKVEPSGRTILHALDVSVSMFMSGSVNGLRPAELAGIMGLTALKSDPKRSFALYFHQASIPASMSERHEIADVLNPRSDFWQGVASQGTDVSIPFRYLLSEGLHADAAVIYTDGQTWAGDRHVSEVVRQVQAKNPAFKAIFVYVVAYDDRVTLTDPRNPAMHDVVASADLPQVIRLILSEEGGMRSVS